MTYSTLILVLSFLSFFLYLGDFVEGSFLLCGLNLYLMSFSGL